jgi:hypothetical protein
MKSPISALGGGLAIALHGSGARWALVSPALTACRTPAAGTSSPTPQFKVLDFDGEAEMAVRGCSQ